MRGYFYCFLLLYVLDLGGQDNAVIRVNIDTENGHDIVTGVSGFNVRIADKVWSYDHPDFQKAVDTLNTGWLRFFSGTMGDAFNSATGLYDYDYLYQFDKQQQYKTGYAFTSVKGPHLLYDLYQVLGKNAARLVITINAFTESPEITRELVRFCVNNDIQVDCWQFCNEPYFYVPQRNRYWWNDGYDYAVKMKPHADTILKYLPDAHIALNFTWDGIWKFMKEIKDYENEKGAYWNTFSKHSYAPHTGRKESFNDAFRRANTKLIEATSPTAMAEIETYSSRDIPMLITEFGVWNKPLNGIYSAIYNVEYTMRQLQHKNTFLIGSHEVSNKAVPAINLNSLIMKAFTADKEINTQKMHTGVRLTAEGQALRLLHQACNKSDFIYLTEVSKSPLVNGLGGVQEEGMYVQAYRGIGEEDFLVITNRSSEEQKMKIYLDDRSFEKSYDISYLYAEESDSPAPILQEHKALRGEVHLKPNSISVITWKNQSSNPPKSPRIYKKIVSENGIKLICWPIENADGYLFYYKDKDAKEWEVKAEKNPETFLEIDFSDHKEVQMYVEAQNTYGKSIPSNQIIFNSSSLPAPAIFKSYFRDSTITVMWKSVPYAEGYQVNIKDLTTGHKWEIDANNTFGYRYDNGEYNHEYEVSVRAYNGLGKGRYSKSIIISPLPNLPVPPRNLSAIQGNKGQVFLRWIEQNPDEIPVAYRLYRGKTLDQWELVAENIKGSFYKDTIVNSASTYYYVMKAYNKVGETPHFTNIATLIKNVASQEVMVHSVEELEKEFIITIRGKNLPMGVEIEPGIIIQDVSYLNLEEKEIMAPAFNLEFESIIKISKEDLDINKPYAIRAFIKINENTIESTPPHKKIILNHEGKD